MSTTRSAGSQPRFQKSMTPVLPVLAWTRFGTVAPVVQFRFEEFGAVGGLHVSLSYCAQVFGSGATER